ncbi:hypothetical protein BC938DRAFT_476937 [Jimgerdemannia flammicorona]|uniref:Uncharacterized protein n=1 Tax=Jimgerdemannia flammicorona TaxID=994334 RepID=A0A433QPY5_9FUNG|nr:hypothetical protein BC938DRAFT_476937 [Jimgerdemannia flammicorona]
MQSCIAFSNDLTTRMKAPFGDAKRNLEISAALVDIHTIQYGKSAAEDHLYNEVLNVQMKYRGVIPCNQDYVRFTKTYTRYNTRSELTMI